MKKYFLSVLLYLFFLLDISIYIYDIFAKCEQLGEMFVYRHGNASAIYISIPTLSVIPAS